MTNVEILQVLNPEETIGLVERFDTDETVEVYMDTSQLVQWAMEVDGIYNSRWCRVAVTPNMPMVAYEETNEPASHGVALAPGMRKTDYEAFKK